MKKALAIAAALAAMGAAAAYYMFSGPTETVIR